MTKEYSWNLRKTSFLDLDSFPFNRFTLIFNICWSFHLLITYWIFPQSFHHFHSSHLTRTTNFCGSLVLRQRSFQQPYYTSFIQCIPPLFHSYVLLCIFLPEEKDVGRRWAGLPDILRQWHSAGVAVGHQVIMEHNGPVCVFMHWWPQASVPFSCQVTLHFKRAVAC